MNKPTRKYGIEVSYVAGGKAKVWYFTEMQRNSIMFTMKADPKINKVKPVRRK